ncbi:acyl-CoA reductase [Sphingobacterium sp. LRF_L2]|uniref:acyl-CoA reductase n=1 Tax=Sphingobacterium sp. LRF_L2 TaxID=3369421 RepID=UPI003F5F19E9
MTQKQRIEAFAKLGDLLTSGNQQVQDAVAMAAIKNPWYTKENTIKQLSSIGSNLTEDKLSLWLANLPDVDLNVKVGVIMAGNVPLVGFHDLLCVLCAGFCCQIKVSSDDAGLTKFVVDQLIQIEPDFGSKIEIVDRLTDYDLVIATGSNNSSRYFEHYFGKKPNIIRKNRNSVALLSGEESSEQLYQLGFDIFDYFGLGCRSVSKIYIPKGFDIARLFEAIEAFHFVKDHFKYGNNYDYNKSIYLINGDKHFDNGFLLLKEDTRIASPLGVLFYEEYDTVSQVIEKIDSVADGIQCLITEIDVQSVIPVFSFGKSQSPSLEDYADGVNVLEFLSNNTSV